MYTEYRDFRGSERRQRTRVGGAQARPGGGETEARKNVARLGRSEQPQLAAGQGRGHGGGESGMACSGALLLDTRSCGQPVNAATV